jgi:hypothetical protein
MVTNNTLSTNYCKRKERKKIKNNTLSEVSGAMGVASHATSPSIVSFSPSPATASLGWEIVGISNRGSDSDKTKHISIPESYCNDKGC